MRMGRVGPFVPGPIIIAHMLHPMQLSQLRGQLFVRFYCPTCMPDHVKPSLMGVQCGSLI